jgi:lipopolysaccharide heptosyltransferase II
MNPLSQYNNILIIKPGAIGDLLQLTPVIRALRGRYPQASLSLLVGSSPTAELFKYNAHIRETIVFDKMGMHKSCRSLVKLWLLLHRNKYDLVLNFQRSNLKTWFLASAAVPCRVLVYHKARTRNVHAVVNYLETIVPLGVDVSNVNLELSTGADDRAFAEKVTFSLGSDEKPLIALNPGASHRVNRWGTDRFAALADMLAQELSAKIIIIGGPEDISLAEEIGAKTASKPLLMAGKANLLQLGALLKQCDILVSGDTGPMHLATAVGTRVVALFGAADPARTGPVGSGHKVIQAEGITCLPCRRRTCSNRIYLECMEKISISAVFGTIRDMLKKGEKNDAQNVRGAMI